MATHRLLFPCCTGCESVRICCIPRLGPSESMELRARCREGRDRFGRLLSRSSDLFQWDSLYDGWGRAQILSPVGWGFPGRAAGEDPNRRMDRTLCDALPRL